MSKSQSNNGGGGIGLGGAVFIVFLVLKLTDKIDWSWWFVTMPLWAGAAIVGAFILLGILLLALAKFGYWLGKRATARR